VVAGRGSFAWESKAAVSDNDSDGGESEEEEDKEEEEDEVGQDGAAEPTKLGDLVLSRRQAEVVAAVRAGENVVVLGSAGTGKSAVLQPLVAELRENGKIVEVTASTGTAACAIGGTTLHKLMGVVPRESHLPVDELAGDLRRRQPQTVARLCAMDVLFVDEVGFIEPAFFVRCVHRLLMRLRGCPKPFGGVQVVVSGDWLQMAPIIDKRLGQKAPLAPAETPAFAVSGSKDTAVPIGSGSFDPRVEFLFELSEWDMLFDRTVELKHVFRQEGREQRALRRALRRFRYGECTDADAALMYSRVGAPLHCPEGIEPTCIYALCRDVEETNRERLRTLDTPAVLVHHRLLLPAVQAGAAKDGPRGSRTGHGQTPRKAPAAKKRARLDSSALPEERRRHVESALAQIEHDLPVPLQLELKVGAQVMLVVNVDVAARLSNGARGVVTRFCEATGLPVVRFATGAELVVQRYEFPVTLPGVGRAHYLQVPLAMCWAVTINRCQGWTIDYAYISLRSVFAPGQSYVALSRVRTLAGISLLYFDPACVFAHPKAVYYHRNGFRAHRLVSLPPEPASASPPLSQSRGAPAGPRPRGVTADSGVAAEGGRDGSSHGGLPRSAATRQPLRLPQPQPQPIYAPSPRPTWSRGQYGGIGYCSPSWSPSRSSQPARGRGRGRGRGHLPAPQPSEAFSRELRDDATVMALAQQSATSYDRWCKKRAKIAQAT
jgi:ATP-dependent DNA helicase PIF1